MEPSVRPYRPSDLEGLYDVCVRTADGGQDARGRYRSDRLVGDLFAAPYAIAEPEHTHVLDDGAGRVVGYVLGTADTPRFVDWYRDTWIPATADRCPPPAQPPTTDDDVMLSLHHRPERLLVPQLAAHPAHLHIDVLPPWQGAGWGRALMATFLAGLHAAGVRGVHLAMLASNVPARRFYDRVGFVELAVDGAPPDLTYLVRDTASAMP